jgi:diacylglycerol kinase family enzyme
MWVVSQMVKYNIKVEDVPIGIVPMGTGNDFSRELGWGSSPPDLIDSSFRRLKKWVKRWVQAKVEDFDVWDIEAESYEVGLFNI